MTSSISSNPDYGLWYRRVTEIRAAKRPQEEQQQGGRAGKRRRVTRPGHSDDDEVDEQEDAISEFRRVQIVQETRDHQGPAEPRPLPELKPLNDKLAADRRSHWALVLGDAERPSPTAAHLLGPPAPLQLPLPPPRFIPTFSRWGYLPLQETGGRRPPSVPLALKNGEREY